MKRPKPRPRAMQVRMWAAVDRYESGVPWSAHRDRRQLVYDPKYHRLIRVIVREIVPKRRARE